MSARGAFAPPSEAVGPGPQVVVGLASPRSESAPPAVVAAEGPPTELASALDAVIERASDRSLELAHEEPAHETLADAELAHAEPAHETLASACDVEPTAAEPAQASEVVPPASGDEDDLPIFAYPIALLNVTHAAFAPVTSSSAAPEAADRTSPLPEPPEESIPPMGDLSVEPHAERFFTEGEATAGLHAEGAHEDWDDHVDPAQHKRAPHVVQRRARFARYVGWAVGVSAVVCLAALARTAILPAAPVASLASGTNGAIANVLEAPAPRAASPAAAPLATAVVEAPKVEVPTAASPAVGEPTSPKAEGALAEAPATTNAGTATPTSDKTALEEKNDARRALERGKVTESIEAGERAVALDPQDGEAWLLLGAAYQEKGKLGDARRCYAACLKQGKRGPLGECQAMLR